MDPIRLAKSKKSKKVKALKEGDLFNRNLLETSVVDEITEAEGNDDAKQTEELDSVEKKMDWHCAGRS